MLIGCIDPFEPVTLTFSDLIVVEAVLTDEVKTQKFFLHRTYRLEEEAPNAEIGAIVNLESEFGIVYEFEEDTPGTYISKSPFAIEDEVGYSLSISTLDGKVYQSSEEKLIAASSIKSVEAIKGTNRFGDEGISILVNSYDPNAETNHYRFEYIETYKVIAPYWHPDRLIPDPNEECGVLKVTDDIHQKICYASSLSQPIILNSTKNLDSDIIENFQVRFVKKNDYKISHRYSILIRQLGLSDQAYRFYQTLNDFSKSESLLSQVQPGFIQGNVFPLQPEEQPVLGLFTLCGVSQKRIFFNYTDYYPNEPLPPYIDTCVGSTPPLNSPSGCVLLRILESGGGIYAGSHAPRNSVEGPHRLVPIICGDCSVLGTPEEPDFWVH